VCPQCSALYAVPSPAASAGTAAEGEVRGGEGDAVRDVPAARKVPCGGATSSHPIGVPPVASGGASAQSAAVLEDGDDSLARCPRLRLRNAIVRRCASCGHAHAFDGAEAFSAA